MWKHTDEWTERLLAANPQPQMTTSDNLIAWPSQHTHSPKLLTTTVIAVANYPIINDLSYS